ncbi:MAG TPA: hypothetical protein VK897_13810 [Anaerolineales bacterium]|nr:hypothetical protein [Anaerolineales bacterium]
MTPIDDKYAQLGGAQGFLGQPTLNETPTANGQGSYRHYDGGSIYWKYALAEAFEVHGPVRLKWGSLGGENSTIGFPTSDQLTTPDTRAQYNHFENGTIYIVDQRPPVAINGPIRTAWAAADWERGPLGYPVSDADQMRPSVSPCLFQDFEKGTMYEWLGTTRTVLRAPASVFLSSIMIDWINLGGVLPDGDRISASFSGHNPNGVILLTLNAGPGITWWKAITLWSASLGDLPPEVWIQDQVTSNTIAIDPSAVAPGNCFLLFKKAKGLGIHTGMYWLRRPDRLLGNNVTFTWLTD